MTTYGQALAAARARLSDAGATSPGLDARLLMGAAAGLESAALIARSREPLPWLAESRFDSHLRRRLRGEPVARIIGEKEFWGLPFAIDGAVLAPRPETEILVEVAVTEARRRFPPDIHICDLGTGSGAIIVALLVELPEAQGTAVDLSEEALAVARRNAERHGVAGRVRFEQGDFASGPDGRFDIMVSNPPYIRTDAIARLEPEVREYEPLLALDGGADGLQAYRVILARVPEVLAKEGFVVLETGHDQGAAVADLCRAAGLAGGTVVPDLAGTGRVVVATQHKLSNLREGPKKRLEISAYRASVPAAKQG
jgi:release factor glutamine methyltransferase